MLVFVCRCCVLFFVFDDGGGGVMNIWFMNGWLIDHCIATVLVDVVWLFC